MSKNNPIGIFDSGVGGLTVFNALKTTLPHESFYYFGDTAHHPYGEKSKAIVTQRALACGLFLQDLGIKLLVVACNTATAFSLKTLEKELNIPVIGVIKPMLLALKKVSWETGLILGTYGTIHSRIYQGLLKKQFPSKIFYGKACPLLAPLVEEGLANQEKLIKVILEQYLHRFHNKKIDAVILACTHYPLLYQSFKNFFPKDTLILDSANSCATELESLLKTKNLLSSQKHKHRFFVSDNPKKFATLSTQFLGQKLGSIKEVSFF